MVRIVCQVNADVLGKQAGFTWGDGTGAFEPYQLEGQCFELFWEAIQNTRGRLADLVTDYLNGPDDDVRKSSLELARAGHELHRELFSPGEAQQHKAVRARKWLEKLQAYDGDSGGRKGAADFLEVVAEGLQTVPWNLVYDREPDEGAFLRGDTDPGRWRPFWGLRYNLAGGRKVDPLRRMPRLPAERVLMILDPHIRAGLPPHQQRRLNRFLQSHRVTAVGSKEELARALKSGRPDLMYWLCHATPQALVLGDADVTPNDLLRMLRAGNPDGAEGAGGLAFLNACQTAESGKIGSFLDAMHQFGLSGTVATEQVTVDTFANRFGLAFLKRFLDRGEPVGALLNRLRWQRSRGVPLGLLYAAYCPPDIYVPLRPAAPPAVSPSALPRPIAPPGGTLLTTPPAAAKQPLPASPYPSLASYDREHRALFAGRDADVERFARLLDAPDTRVLVLHGGSGVGKSSFLLAGVVPYLEEEGIGYRVLAHPSRAAGDRSRERAVLFVRSTNDLAGQLAQRLFDYCAEPVSYQTPTGERVEVDLPGLLAQCLGARTADAGRLLAALRADPALLGRILAALGRRLPYGPVLMIDQGEEVFTLARTPAQQEGRALALQMLRCVVDQPGNYKVIVSLRTEYHGRLIDPLRRGLSAVNGVREYLLTDVAPEQLIEAIRRPTATEPVQYAEQAPFAKYGFRYADGVAEEIARQALDYCALRQDSVLPLVQVICAQLYAAVSSRPDKIIHREDFAGFAGGMRKHVGEAVDRLFPNRSDRLAFKKLFTRLYLRQPDGTLTTALLPQHDLGVRWKGSTPFENVVESASRGELRLLRVNSLRVEGEERLYLSLGHDALAPVAAQWDEELRRGARLRKMAVVTAAALGLAGVMALLATFALVQRDQAKTERRKAFDALDDFWVEVGGEYLNNEPGMEDVRRTMLEKAVPVLEAALKDDGNDFEARTRAARAKRRLADIYRQQDNERDAAESAYKDAIGRLERLAADDPANGDYYRHQLADSYNWLGELRRTAPRERDSAPGGRAADAYDEARKLLEPLVEAHPDVLKYRADLVRSYSNLGVFYWQQGDYPTAKDNLDKAIEVLSEEELERKIAGAKRDFDEAVALLPVEERKRRLADLPEDLKYQSRYRQELARACQNRAMVLRKLGKKNEELAREDYETAIRLFTRVTQANPERREYRCELGQVHNNLGMLLTDTGRPAEAEKHHREARRLLEHVFEDFPGWPKYRSELANVSNSLSRALALRDPPDYAEALKACRRAQSLLGGLAEQFPRNADYKYRLGRSFGNRGWILVRQKKGRGEARRSFEQAIGHLKGALEIEPGKKSYESYLKYCEGERDRLLVPAGK